MSGYPAGTAAGAPSGIQAGLPSGFRPDLPPQQFIPPPNQLGQTSAVPAYPSMPPPTSNTAPIRPPTATSLPGPFFAASSLSAPPMGPYPVAKPPASAPPLGPYPVSPPPAVHSAPPTGPYPTPAPAVAPTTGGYPPAAAPAYPPAQPAPFAQPASYAPLIAPVAFIAPPTAGPAPSAAVQPYPQAARIGAPGTAPVIHAFAGLQIASPDAYPTSANPAAARQPRPAGSLIDQSQVPSPVGYTSRPVEYNTRALDAPPPTTTTFRITARDSGNASPNFMRMVSYAMPSTKALASQSHLQFGAVLQPLSEADAVEVVPATEAGPVRCERCKAYANPFWRFVDGGRQFRCNLCDFVSDTPPHYFSPADPSGMRSDLAQRPELRHGAVDFVVGKDYFYKGRQPSPPCYLFVIEVTSVAVKSGLLRSTCAALQRILPTLPTATKVGLMTYDTAAHFYNLTAGRQQPQMLVMPDTQAGFMPIGREAVVVSYKDSKAAFDSLLSRLPGMFENTQVTRAATGPALQAAVLTLKHEGGRVLFFTATLPDTGAGALKARYDPKLLNTEKEKAFYSSQEMTFWTDLASKCSDLKVCVDLFSFADSFLDLGTLSPLCRVTNGQMYQYGAAGGINWRDEHALQRDIQRSLTRTAGFEALLRMRCSRGLSVGEFIGNYNAVAFADEIELAGLDADKALAVTFRYDDDLPEKQEASFQAALLFTTAGGERRVRVLNVSVPTAPNLAQVYRMTDFDTIMSLLARSAARDISKDWVPAKVRAAITDQAAAMLASYRKHCSSQTVMGQLILPETLKYLPLYALALLKCPMLRHAVDITPDERLLFQNNLQVLGVQAVMHLLHPRMFALHKIPTECGLPAPPSNLCILPPTLKLAFASIEVSGAYLLDNGQRLVLWVGRDASPELLHGLFGVNTFAQLSSSVPLRMLPEVDSEVSRKTRCIIDTLRHERGNAGLPLFVLRQGEPAEQKLLTASMIEEKVNANDAHNYSDYLVHLHREIQSKLN